MLIICATPGNLCLYGWEDKIADEPLGCSEGAVGIGEESGTLSHQFSLGCVEVEYNLLGMLFEEDWLLGTDWRRNKEIHLDIYEETLLVTNIHWVVWQ